MHVYGDYGTCCSMQLIRIKDINEASFAFVNRLYKDSFPINERKDLRFLLSENQDIGEIYVVEEENQFIGFVCILFTIEIAHIIYFSVLPELRNKGYGSNILKLICEMKKGYRVIVDIEKPNIDSNNYEQRVQRKNFYLRNCFLETEVKYKWHGDYFEILSYGGNITDEEFDQFWDSIIQVNENLVY